MPSGMLQLANCVDAQFVLDMHDVFVQACVNMRSLLCWRVISKAVFSID